MAISRIALARCLSGKTQRELASLLGVTPQTLSKMESQNEISPKYFEKLASLDGLTDSFFLSCQSEWIESNQLSFRAKRSLNAKIRDRVWARTQISSELEHVIHPKRSIGTLPEFKEDVSPEEAAQTLRSELGYYDQPIYDLLEIVEKNLAAIYWYSDPTEVTIGVSCWTQNLPFILINSTSGSRQRDNWTIAHELGHLCLHRGFEPIQMQDEQREQEANRFAQEFLLPRDTFLSDIPTTCVLEKYIQLKPKWDVSLQAMIRRAYDLGAIKPWQYEDAFKRISMRGWRRNEPLSDPPRESLLLYDALQEIHPEDVGHYVRKYVGIDASLLQELTRVANYFSSDMPFSFENHLD